MSTHRLPPAGDRLRSFISAFCLVCAPVPLLAQVHPPLVSGTLVRVQTVTGRASGTVAASSRHGLTLVGSDGPITLDTRDIEGLWIHAGTGNRNFVR